MDAGRAQAAESGRYVAELRRRAKRSKVCIVYLHASPKIVKEMPVGLASEFMFECSGIRRRVSVGTSATGTHSNKHRFKVFPSQRVHISPTAGFAVNQRIALAATTSRKQAGDIRTLFATMGVPLADLFDAPGIPSTTPSRRWLRSLAWRPSSWRSDWPWQPSRPRVLVVPIYSLQASFKGDILACASDRSLVFVSRVRAMSILWRLLDFKRLFNRP
jgi:hypothetical protein